MKEMRKRSRKQEHLVLGFLLFVLSSLVVYFFLVFNQEQTQQAQKLLSQAQFKQGQDLKLRENVKKNYKGEALSRYQDKLGVVEKVDTVLVDWEPLLIYKVRFSLDQQTVELTEKDLESAQSLYKLGQDVAVKQADTGSKEGRISQVNLAKTGDEQDSFNVRMSQETVADLPKEDITYIHELPLDENNSSQENNALIQEAINLNQIYSSVIIQFPKGRFKIGSQDPGSDYILLDSNIEMRGNETELVVEGTAYWFALATGVEAHQGVSNFVMRDLDFVANDLVNGDHFMIMANHGENWTITNNSFTMVHKMSSHIFDLGGLQNSVFDGNQFIGYAPELTDVTDVTSRSLHDFFSEAIQLDYSDGKQTWDAGLLAAIDPNYGTNNVAKQLSNNIQISNNQFSAYKAEDGSIIAYSATIGQHSSKVGRVSIYNNSFTDLLTARLSAPDDKAALFEAVHVESNDADNSEIHSNTVQ